ncbi:MAG: type I restriction endonuclease subunit R [Anaerolineae bacterium]|nr:type I restriction endonuclease subunit R [Anaerolineae bacterium]
MDQNRLNELEQVEEPFLRQLERLGWRVLRGDKYDPASTLRESFSEVIIESELRAALKQINPWLEEEQITAIIHRAQTPQANNLLKANEEILTLLLEGWPVDTNHQTREKSPTVRFLDYNYSANNRFLAVSQFKLTVPGTEKHIIPDIVLFVNGLPLVVIECKSPATADPLGEAVEQLKRYANRRGMVEGNEKLFWYNQFQVATYRQKCCYSTITGELEHYIEWKDPYPYKLADIDTEGGETVNSQQALVQGMLAPANLLDIIHSFTVFASDDKGRTIKLVPRYQQYRTARKIITRLKEKSSPAEKGGIVWHTQGSGKSLTMMFVVRAMFHDPNLNQYKIVFITDRTDLEKQLGDTARSVGYSLKKASSIAALKEYLRSPTPDLVMGMIHKFQENELRQQFPQLNPSDKILVMIDEAHRTQYKLLGANLQVALPNAVRVAFTGTPIEKTERTFGEYIDQYSVRQAVEDGVTVEIVYEGRTHKGSVTDREQMNRRFEDVFSAVDKEERQLILDRYTWRAYLEAEEVIRDKAADMLDHYLEQVFPNRFKAQVVAVSRLAAIRYKQALDAALQQKIESLQANGGSKDDLELLKRMKIEVVISGTNNDDAVYKPYTDENQHERVIASFKLPFDQTNEAGISGDVGILVVQSMLITGFDAPIEQVMYLDNVIKEHNLLQAIARVNRISKNKSCGYIVDYVGVAHHLREALSIFDEKDTDEILSVVLDQSADKDNLKYIHSQVKDFFSRYDADLKDIDACVDVLADEEVRDEFIRLLRAFNKAMDRVLPDPEALRFVYVLKTLSWISESARNRYRDEKLSIRDASRKIREIVDEFLISKGVDPKIPPLPIFSDAFKAKIRQNKTARAAAEEITTAIREHINENYETDPEFYERLGEKLEKVLAEYRDNWDRLAKELEEVLQTLEKGRSEEKNYGLNPRTELPFLALLKRELYGTHDLQDLPEEDLNRLLTTTNDILEIVHRETQQVDFWENYPAQKRLKAFILNHLLTTFRDKPEFVRNRNQVGQKIIELAMHIRS